MRWFVVVAGLALTGLGVGCSAVVGIDNLPPASDGTTSSSRNTGSGSASTGRSSSGSTRSTSSASPSTVASCPGTTVTDACQQCIAGSCCAELTACRNNSTCSGAIACFSDNSGDPTGICTCLDTYGGAAAYFDTSYFACSNGRCAVSCGSPLDTGAACTDSGSCQRGSCAFDSTGTYRCQQFCCLNSDCPSTQTCQVLTTIDGLTTRGCN